MTIELGHDRWTTRIIVSLLFLEAGFTRTAGDLVMFGLKQAPDNTQLLADSLILTGNPDREVLKRLFASPGGAVAAEATRVGIAY